MMIIWKPVLGYEGLYQVSNDGKVKGIERVVQTYSAIAGKIVPLKRKEKLLSQNSAGPGYMTVCLSKNGKSKTFRVASLVCEAFHGRREFGMHVCHNNGAKTDNRAENLRWDTPKNNQLDRITHKTDKRGEAVLTSKFTEAQVAEIKNGLKFADASERFSISKTQYYRIRSGKSWAHVHIAPD